MQSDSGKVEKCKKPKPATSCTGIKLRYDGGKHRRRARVLCTSVRKQLVKRDEAKLRRGADEEVKPSTSASPPAANDFAADIDLVAAGTVARCAGQGQPAPPLRPRIWPTRSSSTLHVDTTAFPVPVPQPAPPTPTRQDAPPSRTAAPRWLRTSARPPYGLIATTCTAAWRARRTTHRTQPRCPRPPRPYARDAAPTAVSVLMPGSAEVDPSANEGPHTPAPSPRTASRAWRDARRRPWSTEVGVSSEGGEGGDEDDVGGEALPSSVDVPV
ncbi:hypothetical protein B0H10DRAFT_2443883 [Mycena sp. CBHHK59/15]|nr:hypothetical protein B0H10DRAFT_2443883 [Mycena sp. CBHHK59/15]